MNGHFRLDSFYYEFVPSIYRSIDFLKSRLSFFGIRSGYDGIGTVKSLIAVMIVVRPEGQSHLVTKRNVLYMSHTKGHPKTT